MHTRPPLLLPEKLPGSDVPGRPTRDHVILFVVILLAFLALRYLHGTGGPPN